MLWTACGNARGLGPKWSLPSAPLQKKAGMASSGGSSGMTRGATIANLGRQQDRRRPEVQAKSNRVIRLGRAATGIGGFGGSTASSIADGCAAAWYRWAQAEGGPDRQPPHTALASLPISSHDPSRDNQDFIVSLASQD